MDNRLPAAVLAIIILAGGCAAKPQQPTDSASVPSIAQNADSIKTPAVPDLDDYDEPVSASSSADDDPLEGWNRVCFSFNDFFIRYVLEPLHKSYCFVVPEGIRKGISNFAWNIAFPVRMINSILQGEFAQAGVEFDRSLVNFMVSAGFADVAAQSRPLYTYRPETENLDHTLARWGVADGPYLILPFLGPGTVRSSAAFAGEIPLKPQNYVFDWPYTLGSSLYFNFNASDELYKAYDQITGAAIEPYSALRNAWLERRRLQFAPDRSE